ncbi:MAG: hypothetical protein A3B91_04710 [Candidatus Yanofskybacteria bacterium RIFCSPHIGHO2_02_FULL_41_29]|uniref:Uncharacterized protein n=1 Tax=Candidatus Yanofskybacteria bacterium RIFCSPHIGHO2_01_FULL_41_53 TaxID=1802663 RepID=A0A1F8EHH8_9BACT|nr:MAG: hypothetical protein A2650_04495 [Candidatus Yanofskybacteria bacterium RIFCSPHIGHO2_01_FULL_41_53]OGN11496.1 MAG: hypothetical protein A3B91_04710 [Candidatus Yanofskybacteria bacterium RIFCSPHIGHO2_02_FULL_41_29]OGN22606.1 MAG: hypothetical protein A2916_03105 [Candidatus Yanofskybacteria bacterium RIFCSPLOWO2_01_FULL_41_67]OGN35615.1 MAG: hypothetical protein A3F98_02300 [Candidatus Yanofskybacteria bacterium RIFCSPLOWO2_12_FULL_41_8]
MSESEFTKPALDKFRQWHFWWLVVFSFLLIVTFVYYLPTRFLQQFNTASDNHTETVVDESQPHGHDSSGNSIPSGQEGEHNMMMTDEEMYQHMDEHMSVGMSMEEMMEHMTEMHGMTEDEADQMMDEMMLARRSLGEGGGYEHDEGTADDHGHEATPSPDSTGSPQVATGDIYEASYFEEASIKQGLAVNLNISPVPYSVGVPLNMDFFVNQKPGSVPVLASELQIEHEKLMHVIGVRSDMNEFFHIHPEFTADNPAIFSVDHVFKKPGLYKIWSEIKKDGVNYAFGHPEVNINGPGPRSAEGSSEASSKEDKKVSFSRNVITGDYQVSMAISDVIVIDREIGLSFDIHTLTGQEVDVEEYLGADMHLSVIKDDRSQFIHTHPESGNHGHSLNNGFTETANADAGHDEAPSTGSSVNSGDEAIVFNVTFPEAGLYKAFAQFRPEGVNLPAGEALLAEFWIQVEEKSPLPISQWWLLLIVSAILITGLSWWVKGYLKVRPEDVTVKK